MKYYLLVSVLLCTLSSCVFFGMSKTQRTARAKFTEGNGAIPPEFGKDPKSVFLVCTVGRYSYDKHVKSNIQRYYRGSYEIVDSTKISDYHDKEKYRFYFNHDMGAEYDINGTDGYATGATGYFKVYYVYDRLEGKKYKQGSTFSGFDKAMEEYFKNLELKRQSFLTAP